MEKVQIKDAIFRLFTQTCFCTFVLYTHIVVVFVAGFIVFSSLSLCGDEKHRSKK